MINRKLTILAASLIIVAALGCNKSPSSSDAGKTSESQASATDKVASTEVTLQPIKYAALQDVIHSLHGKIVVVDAWAEYCVPCKAEFPSLINLHERRLRDGVVCISVTVDKKENQEAALEFLKKQKAMFANYLLDEDPKVWLESWGVQGVPVVFVFNRDGQLVRKFDSDATKFTYEDVNKVVDDLLKGGS